MTFQPHTALLTPAQMAAQRSELRRSVRDDNLDRIETLETALDDLKWEARINPLGMWSSPAALEFLRAVDRLTCDDAHAEWIDEITEDLATHSREERG